MKHLSLIEIAFLLFPLICSAEVPTKEITVDEILAAGPEWQKIYNNYKPDPQQIGLLKSMVGQDLKIRVYLGLWCPDSRNNVPRFLRILDEIGVPVPVQYFGVQRKPSKEMKYFVDKAQVERVPTFIFFRGEKEIGRIVENPKVGLCEDMLAILSP